MAGGPRGQGKDRSASRPRHILQAALPAQGQKRHAHAAANGSVEFYTFSPPCTFPRRCYTDITKERRHRHVQDAQRSPDWYRLDNAGVLYSALQREKYSPVYRFSAVLSQPVDPAVLQRAVDRTMPRFPGFRVRMKPGVFWHYFEPNDSPWPFVRPDMSNPASPSASGRTTDGWSASSTTRAGSPWRSSTLCLTGRGPSPFPHPAGGLPPGAGTPHPLRPRPAGRG